MAQQRPDRRADEARGGLGARDREQDGHRDQLAIAEKPVVVGQGDQQAHEVPRRRGASGREPRAHVVAEGAPGRLARDDERAILGDREGVQAPRQGGRPDGDRRSVRLGDSEEVADDGARQRLREGRDHVDLVRPVDAIQQSIGDRSDARPEDVHDRRREGIGDEVAEPRMTRRVAEEHRLPRAAVGLRFDGRGTPPTLPVVPAVGREVPLEALAAEPRVAEDRGHVGVAREDPESVGCAVDRIFGAEARVDGIRIGQERGIGRTEERGATDPLSVVSSFVDPPRARPVIRLRLSERLAGHARSRGQRGCQGRRGPGPHAERAGVTRSYVVVRPSSRGRRFHREATAFPPRGGFAVAERWSPERIPGASQLPSARSTSKAVRRKLA